MNDSTTDQSAAFEESVHALVAARTAAEMNDALDLDAILGDGSADDPVDVDQFADAIGRPVGRLIASRLVDDDGLTGVTKRAVGGKLTRRVTAETVRVILEAVDTDAIAQTLADEVAHSGSAPTVDDRAPIEATDAAGSTDTDGGVSDDT